MGTTVYNPIEHLPHVSIRLQTTNNGHFAKPKFRKLKFFFGVLYTPGFHLSLTFVSDQSIRI
jgi:hypothetical protein